MGAHAGILTSKKRGMPTHANPRLSREGIMPSETRGRKRKFSARGPGAGRPTGAEWAPRLQREGPGVGVPGGQSSRWGVDGHGLRASGAGGRRGGNMSNAPELCRCRCAKMVKPVFMCFFVIFFVVVVAKPFILKTLMAKCCKSPSLFRSSPTVL